MGYSQRHHASDVQTPQPHDVQAAISNSPDIWNTFDVLLLLMMQDYLIAEGYNNATAKGKGKAVSFEAKYYFSQDGAK
jgi:hypothetical protein